MRTKECQDFALKLKNIRIEAGLTQAEVVKKREHPQSYISKLEASEQRLDVAELKKYRAL